MTPSAVVGVIGGSGLSQLTVPQQARTQATTTPWGPPSAPPRTGLLAGVPVVFIPRHGDRHEIPPHRVNYRANVWALHALGVRSLIGINAVGAIAPWFTPGSLALPDQLIDYTWGRGHSYWDEAGGPVRHIDFTVPMERRLHALLADAGAELPTPPIGHGVYGVTQGPRLETAAEVRRLQRDGCDMVGMTLMPEAALARELGLSYACVAFAVNRAAGCGPIGLHAEIQQHLVAGAQSALALVDRSLPAVAAHARGVEDFASDGGGR